jgi:hypothetical protein
MNQGGVMDRKIMESLNDFFCGGEGGFFAAWLAEQPQGVNLFFVYIRSGWYVKPGKNVPEPEQHKNRSGGTIRSGFAYEPECRRAKEYNRSKKNVRLFQLPKFVIIRILQCIQHLILFKRFFS